MPKHQTRAQMLKEAVAQHRAAAQAQARTSSAKQEQAEEKEAYFAADGAGMPLSPSQMAQAQRAGASRKSRVKDTSRFHSLYTCQFKAPPPHSLSGVGGKHAGADFFASHNKSYVRACMQDPDDALTQQQQQQQPQQQPPQEKAYPAEPQQQPRLRRGADPASSGSLLHFAAEVTLEQSDPSRRRRVHQPISTNTLAYRAPPAEVLAAERAAQQGGRAGAHFRQAGNKSYIGLNLLDPQLVLLTGTKQAELAHWQTFHSALPDEQKERKLGARLVLESHTTSGDAFKAPSSQPFSSGRTVRFGQESGPHENPWQHDEIDDEEQ